MILYELGLGKKSMHFYAGTSIKLHYALWKSVLAAWHLRIQFVGCHGVTSWSGDAQQLDHLRGLSAVPSSHALRDGSSEVVLVCFEVLKRRQLRTSWKLYVFFLNEIHTRKTHVNQHNLAMNIPIVASYCASRLHGATSGHMRPQNRVHWVIGGFWDHPRTPEQPEQLFINGRLSFLWRSKSLHKKY